MLSLHAVECDEKSAVGIVALHLETLLDCLARSTIEVADGGAVDFKTILLVGSPLATHEQCLTVHVLQLIACLIPCGVNLCIEVYHRRVDLQEWEGALQRDVLVRIQLARCIYREFHRLNGHDAIVGFTTLLALVLLFLPVVVGFLLLLLSLRIRHLRHHRQRIDVVDELAKRVGDVVLCLYEQRVLIDEGGVAQPIGDGIGIGGSLFVALRRCFLAGCRMLVPCPVDEEGTVGVEVQASQHRNFVVSVGEIERQPVGFLTLGFDEHTVGHRLGEGTQDDIVGHIVDVRDWNNTINVQGVLPDGVVARVGLRRWCEDIVRVANLLTLLRERVVAVGILQGEGTVAAGGDALDDEVAATVGARDA